MSNAFMNCRDCGAVNDTRDTMCRKCGFRFQRPTLPNDPNVTRACEEEIAAREARQDAAGVQRGDGAERRVEAFIEKRHAEIRSCSLGCGEYGQCKANMHGVPSECPARGSAGNAGVGAVEQQRKD